MYSLSIVIPVYNEKENIVQTLNNIKNSVKTPHDILIVYDFDDDNTLPLLKNFDVHIVKNLYGTGVLGAIKTGMEAAENEFVLITMADSSDNPEDIDIMIKKAKQENLDIVCGSRYMKGGKQIKGGFKSLLSRVAGLSLCWLARLPTHDATNIIISIFQSF